MNAAVDCECNRLITSIDNGSRERRFVETRDRCCVAKGWIMRLALWIITGLVLLIAESTATFGQTNRKAEDTLLAADAGWMKVYAAKDLERAIAFCDDEASMLPPNAPIATGKEALRKLMGTAFAIPDYTLSWQANKVGVAHSGELGYTSGTYDFSLRDASGKNISDRGKYLTVWKKEADGSWKVLLDMFSSDLPPSPATPPA